VFLLPKGGESPLRKACAWAAMDTPCCNRVADADSRGVGGSGCGVGKATGWAMSRVTSAACRCSGVSSTPYSGSLTRQNVFENVLHGGSLVTYLLLVVRLLVEVAVTSITPGL
jgi:hypothetical protein